MTFQRNLNHLQKVLTFFTSTVIILTPRLKAKSPMAATEVRTVARVVKNLICIVEIELLKTEGKRMKILNIRMGRSGYKNEVDVTYI